MESRWWVSPTHQKASRKAFFLLEKKTSCIKRLDVWPFFLFFYPILLCLWIPYVGTRSSLEAETPPLERQTTSLSPTLLIVITVAAAALHLLVHLASYWSVTWDIFLGFRRLDKRETALATHCLIKPTKLERKMALCPLIYAHPKQISGSTKLEYLKKRYTLTTESALSPLYFPSSAPLKFYVDAAKRQNGLSAQDVAELRDIYGTNNFEIVSPSFLELFKEHTVAPFFVFQLFCVLLWLLDEYWAHSLMTLVLLVFLEAQLVFKRLNELKELRAMRLTPVSVYVFREGGWRTVLSDDLLPGDIMALPCVPGASATKKAVASSSEFICPCDALLLQGTAIMNESALTGESVPQCKVPLVVDKENELELLELRSRHRQHILSAGTSVITTQPDPKTACRVTCLPLPPNASVCCYVLKTGFETTQGRIVRTILYASDRVTGENSEALIFLVVLLICSFVASAYVLWHSWSQSFLPNGQPRSRYKLLLNCIMIITSVVPPEFPITMSMAVTLSLVELFKRKIFCTEPFRLPFAGRATVCAFDKTGTLTTDRMDLRAILAAPSCEAVDMQLRERLLFAHTTEPTAAQETPNSPKSIPQQLPFCTVAVLVACHSLAPLPDGTLSGDPVECAAFRCTGKWTMRSMDVIRSSPTERDAQDAFTVLRRFPFASEMRRMTSVVHHTGCAQPRTFSDPSVLPSSPAPSSLSTLPPATQDPAFSQGSGLYVVSKGSPEVIRTLLGDIPKHYDTLFEEFNRSGFRVLAMACKKLDKSSGNASTVSQISRDVLESQLHFAGFMIISCRIKPGTEAAIVKLQASSHRVIMITGDHPLTSCQVAKDVKMITTSDVSNAAHGVVRTDFLILSRVSSQVDKESNSSGTLQWVSRNDQANVVTTPFLPDAIYRLSQRHPLCVTGTLLDALQASEAPEIKLAVIRHTTVFARVTPQQKEEIVVALKSFGHIVIMCGDGTNDVGALKSAHLGVSLLSSDAEEPTPSQSNSTETPAKENALSKKPGSVKKSGYTSRLQQLQQQLERAAQEDAMGLPQHKMGTASIASPFTHKGPTICCVPNIIRYGRATLATVMMSYKTMAINSLITAFALSVLTLDGVKFGDFQTTVENFFVSFLVFISSKAQPARLLSNQRRDARLFSFPVLLSIFGQAMIHLFCLYYGWQLSSALRPTDYQRDVDGEFSANLTNTVVFLIFSAMHGATFLANYNGPPSMITLKENRLLWKGMIVFYVVLTVLTLELMPSLNELFALVPLPSLKFKVQLVSLLLVDVLGSWFLGRCCSRYEISS